MVDEVVTGAAITRWVAPPGDDVYRTEPAAARDPLGRAWVAWQERDAAGHERIALGPLPAGEGDEAALVALRWEGAPGWIACAPALVAIPGGLALLWLSLAGAYGGGARCEGRALWLEPDGALRVGARALLWEGDHADAVSAAWQGGALCAALACREGDQHCVRWLQWAPDEASPRATGRWDLSPHHLRRRAALDVSAQGRAFVAWEAHAPGRCALRGALLGPDGAPSAPWTLSASLGADQQPSPRWGERGELWLALSSDSPQRQAPSLARWIKLLKVDPDARRVWAAPPPPGQALEASGEDQSLEAPSLWVAPDGGLWVAARASHSVKLQGFGAAGWGPLRALEPSLWGCRGPWLRWLQRDGEAALISHGRRGLQEQRLMLPAQGPPALELLQEEAPSAPMAPVRRAARPAWAPLGRAYWGDIHFHTAHSDGVGTIEEAYLRSRDRYGDDFACLTDHDAFLGRRVTGATWRAMVEAAERFHDPAEGFATLIGIEYTGPRYPGPGHKCVYLPGPDAPLVCRWDGLEEPAALLARVAALGGFAIPHHVGWLGGDPDHHDPARQPCWEVCSAHGQYEAPRDDPDAPPLGYREGLPQDQAALQGHFLRRQLEAGQVFGFVGGSDGHGLLWHHGISPKADSHRAGLTGAWLEALGRDALMDAIRARRCFATSGAPLALGFTLDGAPLGARLEAPPALGMLEVFYKATATVEELVVLALVEGRIGAVARSAPAAQEGTWAVSLPAQALGPRGCVYVRLSQRDGEVAWASPVSWGG